MDGLELRNPVVEDLYIFQMFLPPFSQPEEVINGDETWQDYKKRMMVFFDLVESLQLEVMTSLKLKLNFLKSYNKLLIWN